VTADGENPAAGPEPGSPPEPHERPGGEDSADALMVMAQRAAGVVAARRRGDHAGAVALLDAFADADQRAMGFYVVADLAVLLLSQASGRSVEECLQDMALVLATGASGP
jgi:hypothetical protein